MKKPAISPTQTISQRVNAARIKSGMTVAALGQALKLSPSYTAHMLAGRRGLTPERAIVAAQVLNVDLVRFLRPEQARMVKAVAEALGVKVSR